jgi:hypothetical protein
LKSPRFDYFNLSYSLNPKHATGRINPEDVKWRNHGNHL